MKTSEKEKARGLRAKGKSLGYISEKLNVSKGSVSVWVRDIELTTGQRKKIDTEHKKKSIKTLNNYRPEHIKKHRDKRLNWQMEGRKKAREKDTVYAFACGIFYGEGSKRRNVVNICNCDAELLVFFVKFLRRCFKIKNSDLRGYVDCYVNENLTIDEIHKYWSEKLKIPVSQFSKPTSRYGHYYKHKYGVCTVRIHKTSIVQKIFGSIKEYMNEKGNRWLD
jgi:hypothetical protein